MGVIQYLNSYATFAQKFYFLLVVCLEKTWLNVPLDQLFQTELEDDYIEYLWIKSK